MTDRMPNERIEELSEIQLYLDRDGDICRTGGGDNLVGCPAMSDDVMKGALNEAEWDAIPEAFDALRQTLADLAQAEATIAARDAEIARLRKLTTPQWFYPADGHDVEQCCFDVNEALDEHYFWDRPKTGQHVVEINTATSCPSIWAAVRFECVCTDPEDCDCDNEMIVTHHETEEEARAALKETEHD